MDVIDPRTGSAIDDLGFALRLAQVAVFKDLIRALEPFNLRPAHYTALSLIDAHPGLEQQDLGPLLHVQKPNLVGLIDDLSRRGLISRERRVRSYALSLTADGAALLSQAVAAAEAHEARVSDATGGPVQRAALLAGLRRLVEEL